MKSNLVSKMKLKWRDCALSAFFAFLLVLTVLPSFYSIGKLLIQICLTAFLAFAVSILSVFIKNGVRIMGYSLSIFLFIMLSWCFIAQLIAQLKSSVPFKEWIYIFYYDKPLTVSIVWAAVFFTFLFIRLVLPLNSKHKSFFGDFQSFAKTSGIAFFIFYLCILIYGFVIIRTRISIGDISLQRDVNFVPLSNIINYLNGDSIQYNGGTSFYENFMYLCGNILIFAPLGFFILIYREKLRWYILLIPVVLSSMIEISQLLLHNGSCDIDDVILNTIGFYLGILIFKAVNLLRKLITGGEETTIFHR